RPHRPATAPGHIGKGMRASDMDRSRDSTDPVRSESRPYRAMSLESAYHHRYEFAVERRDPREGPSPSAVSYDRHGGETLSNATTSSESPPPRVSAATNGWPNRSSTIAVPTLNLRCKFEPRMQWRVGCASEGSHTATALQGLSPPIQASGLGFAFGRCSTG